MLLKNIMATTRIQTLKQEVEKLQRQHDEALSALENAQSKIQEIEDVCTEAHHTINDLCYQVNFWERKYQNLKETYGKLHPPE